MELVKPDNRGDFEEAFKKNRDLSDQDFSSLDLSRIKLLGFNGKNLNLSQANLEGAVVAGANLKGANLSDARLRGTLVAGVNLEDADLTGADLNDSKWLGTNVSGADFTGASTVGAKSSGVSWSSAKVPPRELPESMIPFPIWLPVLLVGVLTLALILIKKQRSKS